MNSLLFSKIKAITKFSLLLGFLINLFCNSHTIFAQKKDFIVVLDAGHGGKDPGKVGYKNSKEKEIALKIVLQLGELLEKHNFIKVAYTRKTDVFVDLWERGRIANKADADLFVSIHCNAHNSQASGAETWVLGTHANRQNFEVAKAENSVILLEENYKTNYKGFDPNSPESVIGLTLMQEEYLDQSIQLASLIQSGFTSTLKRKNRGVKQAGFVVLYQTFMPSVLIETGFLTNRIEGSYLNSKIGQEKFSESIYRNINKYIQQLTLNTVTSAVNEAKISPIKSAKINYKKVKFKVQIAAGTSKLETKPYNFKGLKNVERFKIGKLYKYYIGKTSDYSEIKKLQQLAKSKGYRSSFIVAFRDGKKISVEEVLKKS